MVDRLIQYLTVDLNIYDLQSIRLKQYNKNSQRLIISVTENNQPYFVDKTLVTCAFKMITPDDRAIYNDCTINDDGTITVDITESCCIKPGRGEAELDLFTKDDFQICTMNFHIIIEKSVYDNDKVIASPEFDLLTKTITENKRLNEELIENENARNDAENLRKQSEVNREIAESMRSDAERERVEREQSRVDSENLRIDAEKKREESLSNALQQIDDATSDAIKAANNADEAAERAKEAAESCKNIALCVTDDGVLYLDV